MAPESRQEGLSLFFPVRIVLPEETVVSGQPWVLGPLAEPAAQGLCWRQATQGDLGGSLGTPVTSDLHTLKRQL